MKILALDTSTEACSAALLSDNKVSSRNEVAPRKHAELILPMVDSLLLEAGLELVELDAIAFGRGPGAFTGVRIAAGVTQGLAYASNLPIIPVSSLAALAQIAVGKADNIVAAIDARMGEVYYCQFSADTDLVKPICKEIVSKPEQVPVNTDMTIFGVGTGWDTYTAILSEHCQDKLLGYESQAFPLAEHIIPLAVHEFEQNNSQEVKQAVPVYLRNNVTG